MKNFIVLFLLILPSLVFAHGNEKRDEKKNPTVMILKNDTHKNVRGDSESMDMDSHSTKTEVLDNDVIEKINLGYMESVQPIFEKKCYNCHSNQAQYPWYYFFPGAKQLIDHDIAEAKEHMDMSNGFPFGGHGSPLEDLKSLVETVQENTMPPLRYKIANWESALSEEDKEKIISWIESSEKLLIN